MSGFTLRHYSVSILHLASPGLIPGRRRASSAPHLGHPPNAGSGTSAFSQRCPPSCRVEDSKQPPSANVGGEVQNNPKEERGANV